MSIFPLTFKEVTACLGGTHLVAMPKTSALQSRIKDFQRRGFPPGLNTGKGRAAEYQVEHIILLSVAFEFLELGMAPERICDLLGKMSQEIIDEVSRLVSSQRGTFLKKNRTLLYFDPDGLADLRVGGETGSADAAVHICKPSDFARKLTALDQGFPRFAVLDLYRMILDLLIALAGACDVPDDEVTRSLVDWALQK